MPRCCNDDRWDVWCDRQKSGGLLKKTDIFTYNLLQPKSDPDKFDYKCLEGKASIRFVYRPTKINYEKSRVDGIFYDNLKCETNKWSGDGVAIKLEYSKAKGFKSYQFEAKCFGGESIFSFSKHFLFIEKIALLQRLCFSRVIATSPGRNRRDANRLNSLKICILTKKISAETCCRWKTWMRWWFCANVRIFVFI